MTTPSDDRRQSDISTPPTTTPMTESSAAEGQDMKAFGRAYRGVRERMSGLVLALSDDELQQHVPACPDWTIKNLVAHVTGIVVDMLAGNVAEAGQPDWTKRQIAERERPVDRRDRVGVEGSRLARSRKRWSIFIPRSRA